jgi:hypothetical protein
VPEPKNEVDEKGAAEIQVSHDGEDAPEHFELKKQERR